MVDIKNKGYESPYAIHPGESVREALEHAGMTQADLSVRTQISEKTISLILNGQQPVTPETALKLERVLDISYDLLIGMQAQYEADSFRIQEKERLLKETEYLDKYTCYNELAVYGFVAKTKDKLQKVEELLRFFNVNSLTSIEDVFSPAYRRSDNGKISNESLAAWLHIGRIEAQKRSVPDFNRTKLIENLQKMRNLTTHNPKDYSQALVELCAEAGVVLVYTPYLKRTCVNGAARWLTPNRPLIQVSIYNKYADIFWFTLFHELGHILKHSKKESFVDLDNQELSQMEEEANKFSQEILIPPDRERDFQRFKSELNKINIKQKTILFAKNLGLDPGIVAGRVGRELGAWRYVSPLRKRLALSNDRS